MFTPCICLLCLSHTSERQILRRITVTVTPIGIEIATMNSKFVLAELVATDDVAAGERDLVGSSEVVVS